MQPAGCDDQCKGRLKDTIIHFGEQFDEKIINEAIAKSEEADLSICIGSKLTVTPASEMPFYSKRKIIKMRKTRNSRKSGRSTTTKKGKVNNRTQKNDVVGKHDEQEQQDASISCVAKVVICNLQATPMDEEADLVINHYCDEVMKLVMQKLEAILQTKAVSTSSSS
jgi:NAD-dependent SIR2 family protein deacetylase